MNNVNITLALDANTIYTGSKLEPKLVVTHNGTTLVKDEDFSVVYGSSEIDNISVANGGYAVITPISSNWTGSKEFTFIISPKLLTDSSIIVASIDPKTYNSAQITPELTITDTGRNNAPLVANTDYQVIYGANEFAGTGAGSVEITGTGNYAGTIYRTNRHHTVDVHSYLHHYQPHHTDNHHYTELPCCNK